MSDFTLADLAALPRPEIIETLDFEAVLAARKQDLVARATAFGFNYDVDGLETDPGIILLQEAAFKEIWLRERGNDIARSRYLFYARGAEVDHLGAFYDTLRMPGESDTRYKTRIILGVQGRSTGGTAPRYRSIAMGASIRVADAVVYTEGLSPQVNVAVFATDNNGVADGALLAAVDAAVQADNVRMVNDRIVVRSAVVSVVPVTADIWLLPNADAGILATLQSTIPAAWAAESGLGRDLTVSWLTSRLMVSGVQRVSLVSPTADVVMAPFQAVRISSVALTLRGRDF
jgi:phage-related baseplate assembly protein